MKARIAILLFVCSSAFASIAELIELGYPPKTARKIFEQRPDVSDKILAERAIPSRLYRVVEVPPDLFNPHHSQPLKNIGHTHKNAICAYGGAHACLCHLGSHITKKAEGTVVGTMLEFHVPEFMILPTMDALSPTQIDPKWLKGDQSPFVSRIAPVVKDPRGPQEDYFYFPILGDWVDYE